eukprot:scaffold12292_cov112-Isochrysis_galbana.AAC.7
MPPTSPARDTAISPRKPSIATDTIPRSEAGWVSSIDVPPWSEEAGPASSTRKQAVAAATQPANKQSWSKATRRTEWRREARWKARMPKPPDAAPAARKTARPAGLRCRVCK